MRIVRLLLIAVLLLSSVQMFAQATASAAITGTVMDSSHAAIVGATVTSTNLRTGEVRTTKTNSTGEYRFDLLPVGVYTIKASNSGFAAATATNIELLVGRTLDIDLTLKPGAASESIEVTTQAPIVDALKTSVTQEITPTEVEEMPMVARDVANLAYLAPGVKAADSYDPTKNRFAILSVNGQSGRNVNVTVNGVDNKDNTVGGPVMQLPLEAVEEFSISTQRFSAANGRSEGAAINMITKSGTNTPHGSLFSYFRDQSFNADQKKPDGSTVNPPYSRQQFGGSLGGPIAKNKLFAFFAYERQREHTTLAESPDAFTELTLAKPLGAEAAAIIPTPFFETRYSGRMDWQINSKNSAYLTYNAQGNNSLNDQSDGTGDLTNGNYTTNQMQLANLTVNSALSSSLVNTATFGFQYWNNVIASNISKPLVTFPSASFGTNTNVPQQSFQRKWQFKDDISKTIGNHSLKAGVDYVWNPVLGGYFEYSSTLEVDFGADPSCMLATVNDPVNLCGPAYYPQGFASKGAVVGMSIANGDPSTNVPGGTKQFGVYLQDDWKASKRLTLNLGLRWDKDFNMVGGTSVHDSRTYQEIVALNSPLSNPYVAKQPKDDNRNFSPRVGFAYDLTGSGRHLLRGGAGMYYGNIFQNIPLFMEQQHNPTIFQGVFSLSDTDVVPGTGIPLDQWQYGVSPMPTVAPPSSQLTAGSTGRLIDPNYRNPLTEEFNIGYSYALTPKSVIEAEYVHVLSLHENKTVNINPKLPTDPNDPTTFVRVLHSAFVANPSLPELASVRNEMSVGRSRYDGINLSFRQRMARHVSVNANYTLGWANGYNSGSGSFRNYPRDPRNLLASYEWGPSFNDERHHFTFSGIFELPWKMQFSPILQFGSARPYNPVTSTDYLGMGTGRSYGPVVPISDPTNYTWALTQTTYNVRKCYYTGQCTIAKYDALRGDPFFELDVRLAKTFKFGEKYGLQVVAQAFNLTNRANYGNNFQGDINSADFRKPIDFINPTAVNTPRSVWGEFGFRFTF